MKWPLCVISVCVCVCAVCGNSAHQGGFDTNALGGLESQGQIPDLEKKQKTTTLGVETPSTT